MPSVLNKIQKRNFEIGKKLGKQRKNKLGKTQKKSFEKAKKIGKGLY